MWGPAKILQAVRADYQDYIQTYYERIPRAALLGAIFIQVVYFAAIYDGHTNVHAALFAIASALLVGVALRHYWPRQLGKYYWLYHFFTVTFSLQFLFTYVALENDLVAGWQIALIAVWAILVIFLPNMVSYLATFLTGTLSGVVVHGVCVFFGLCGVEEGHNHFLIISENRIFLGVYIGVSLAGLFFSQSRIKVDRAKLEAVQVYAAQMAHELRRPILGIAHGLYALDRMEKSDPGYPEIRRLLDNEIDHAKALFDLHTSSVINNINTSEFDYISATECVREAIATYPYKSEDEKQSIFFDPAGVVNFQIFGSGVLTKCMLHNLFKNACDALIKTNTQARIEIRIGSNEKTNFLQVVDNGPGISRGVQKKIFRRFFTTAADPQQGVGLGLDFVKRVMESYNGDVTVDSEPGGGATFTLHFPKVAGTRKVREIRPKQRELIHY